jgi:2-polyprenyl-6-methoxyphenol hydroxylase-like FAD-dependent oxidoreductase
VLTKHNFRHWVAVDNSRQDGVSRVSMGEEASSTPFRVNWNKLESILREGQTFQLEHSLSAATIPEDGTKVELSFQSGLKLRPTLVVDALGIQSQLRKSLLPGITSEMHPFAVYSGKWSILSNLFLPVYAPAFRNGNMVVYGPRRSGDPGLEITVNKHQPNRNIRISYVSSRLARVGGY